jgi:L-fuculokinase
MSSLDQSRTHWTPAPVVRTNDRSLVAVLDIGKTNAKLVVADPRSGEQIWSRAFSNRPLAGAPYLAIDAAAIEAFVLAALCDAARRAEIGVIVPVAHGACAALVTAEGLALPVMDYEEPALEEVAETYRTLRDSFAETGSAFLPFGLNLGRQLYFLETRFPEQFTAARHLLLWPQYWAWRLSGVLTSEVTALGCHSDLWRPRSASFSGLAERHGWARLVPPLKAAGAVIGTITGSVAAQTGLDPSTVVLAGIHDSNASFLRHRLAHKPGEPFVVVSTGTWTVILAAGGRAERLDEARDCLLNVDALGEPIPTARFMGGREYAAIAGDDGPTPTFDHLEAVLTAGAVAWPCFTAAGGPFQGRIGRIEGADGFDEASRTALAVLYCALVADVSLDLLGSCGPIVVEGPFADNPLFGTLLAAFRPTQLVSLSHDRAGTVGGALALVAPEDAAWPRLTPCASVLSPRLGSYHRAWRAQVELPQRTPTSPESPDEHR